MVYVQSMVNISDNSGALLGKCIRIVRNNSSIGMMGDVVIVTLKKVFEKRNLKKSKRLTKGQLCKVLIMRTVRSYKRWGNFFISSGTTCGCVINELGMPLATRLFGPIFIELRHKLKYRKIVSLAPVSI